MNEDEQEEALRLLRAAKGEYGVLYHFAISRGALEAYDPIHRQIQRFLEAVQSHETPP